MSLEDTDQGFILLRIGGAQEGVERNANRKAIHTRLVCHFLRVGLELQHSIFN